MPTLLECLDDVIINLKEELINAIPKIDGEDDTIEFIEQLLSTLRRLKIFKRELLKSK